MKNKSGFTLAEVLITLAIIGVVAALTIPSVVANTQQQEFKTGLKKAVSVLNSAITMNMALEGESPYDTNNLYEYFGRHMSVMKSMAMTPKTVKHKYVGQDEDYGIASGDNIAFYTTDGMRFEFPRYEEMKSMRMYESNSGRLRSATNNYGGFKSGGDTFKTIFPCDPNATAGSRQCSFCGSLGLNNNPDDTKNYPCYIVVDVNGDRKPFPKNASCYHDECATQNTRIFSDPNGKKLTDTFGIMITDKQAIPYGTAAQKAMYEAQK